MPDELGDRCRKRLTRLLGIGDAEATMLLRDLESATRKQALEQLAGDGPVTTSLTAHRAQLVSEVCREAKRILSAREIAVLLRVSESTAASVRREMLSAYESALQEFLERFALEEASWSWYKDASGDRARKLTTRTTPQAVTLENELRRRGRWKGIDRDGRSLLFVTPFDFAAADLEPA